jgi:hypothetical protein
MREIQMSVSKKAFLAPQNVACPLRNNNTSTSYEQTAKSKYTQ